MAPGRWRSFAFPVALAAAVGLAGAACSSGTPKPAASPHPTVPAPTSTSLITQKRTPLGDISIEMRLPSRTIRSGGSMNATVVVDNRTGAELHLVDCDGPFQIALGNDKVKPHVGWYLCAHSFTVPRGPTTYPVTVMARYHECANAPRYDSDIRCAADGRPPDLPPGTYQASLFQQPMIGPNPAPVDVTVTR